MSQIMPDFTLEPETLAEQFIDLGIDTNIKQGTMNTDCFIDQTRCPGIQFQVQSLSFNHSNLY